MTNAALIALLRRTTGPVYVTALVSEGVIHVRAVKADLIEVIQTYGADEPAIWRVYEHEGTLTLDA